MKSFTVKFGTQTEHCAQVVIHGSLAAMRRCLRRVGHKDPKHTLAACWQPSRLIKKDGSEIVVAEIHFCPEHLDLDTILHESVHAAWHRAVVAGIPVKHESFQEWVATDAGVLAQEITRLV
jgi:hypothetical protein